MDSTQARIEKLERQVRRSNRAQGACAVIVVAACSLGMSRGTAPSGTFSAEEITVSRLNIAGEDGVNRIVMASEMPTAPFGGVELERSVPPGLAGMIFCAPNGDEVGGIGVSGSPEGGHALLALDYRGIPLEAMGMVTRYTPSGQTAHLIFMDNPDPDSTIDVRKIADNDEAEIKKLQALMVDRIQMGVADREASLVLADSHGQDRIVMRVGDDGTPALEFLAADGTVLLRLPSPE